MSARPKPVKAGRVRGYVSAGRGSRPGGVWYWRWVAWTPDGDRACPYEGERWLTRRDAERVAVQLAAAGADLEAGTQRAPSAMPEAETVRDLLAIWLGAVEARADLAPRTVRGLTQAVYGITGVPEVVRRRRRSATTRKTDEGTIGFVRLEHVTGRTLELHRDRRLAAGYATATVRRELVVLRQAWSWARTMGVTNVDAPALPSLRVRAAREAYTPTLADVAASMEHMRMPWERLVTWTLLATGARIGEVAAMRCGDVDRPGRQLRMRGKTGPRWVPVQREVVEALAELASDRPADAHLWPVSEGTIRGSRYLVVVREACDAAEVRRWTPHGLRRLAVDTMCRAGVEVAAAATITGHDVRTMWRHYRQVTETDRREAVARAQLGVLPGAVVDLDTRRRG